jgi:hypothetical protein
VIDGPTERAFRLSQDGAALREPAVVRLQPGTRGEEIPPRWRARRRIAGARGRWRTRYRPARSPAHPVIPPE